MKDFKCRVDGCAYEGESWRGLSNHINWASGHENVDKSVYIRDEVERVIEEEMDGEIPSQEEFDKKSHITANTVWEINGGLSKTIDEIGYDSYYINKQKLLKQIREVSDKYCNGNAPRYKEIGEHGKYHKRAYYEYFDSYVEAVKECGLEPYEIHNISNDILFEEINRLSDIVNGVPTCDEMMELGRFSPDTYINNFGSWNDALENYGFDVDVKRTTTVDVSYKYHTGDYNKKREEALERAGGICEHPYCDKEKSNNGYSLDCHHIIPKRLTENPGKHKLDNLLILCRKHHQEIEPSQKLFN